MSASGPVVLAGEALVDIVVPVTGEPENAPGGSPLNVAVGLSRLGVETLLLTELGDDEMGDLVVEHVRSSGVRLAEGSVRPARRTSTATATLDAGHAATYDFDLTWDLEPQRLPDDARALHVGSIGASLRPGRDAVVDLVGQAVAADLLVSYDPNARPAFLPDTAQAYADLLEVAAASSLVKLSDEDVEIFAPGREPADVARELLAASERTRLVVVTLGGTAAEAYTRHDTVRVTSHAVEVADTVGAGDSFMGGLVATVLDWGLDLDADQLTALLTAAHEVAAITVSRRGANPPALADLPEGWPRSVSR